MRLDPNAIGALGARLRQRQRAGLGDERQDDHRGDGRRDPRARRDPARAQPGRREHGGRDRHDAARGRAARAEASPASWACSRSTSCGWTRSPPQLHPRAILLGNLFRDQLDRYGELETIAERWAARSLQRGRELVLNADDPLIADLGRERADALYFGVEDDSLALPGMAHAADAKHCRRCGAPYVFDAIYLGHLGHYHCPSCGQRGRRPP